MDVGESRLLRAERGGSSVQVQQSTRWAVRQDVRWRPVRIYRNRHTDRHRDRTRPARSADSTNGNDQLQQRSANS